MNAHPGNCGRSAEAAGHAEHAHESPPAYGGNGQPACAQTFGAHFGAAERRWLLAGLLLGAASLLVQAGCRPKRGVHEASSVIKRLSHDVTKGAEGLGKKAGAAVGLLPKKPPDYVRNAYGPGPEPLPLAGPLSLTQEREFGRALAAELFLRHPRYEDKALNTYLNLSAAAVCAFSDQPDLPCCVAVTRNETETGYGLPGGYILVSLGALRACGSESELAGLLGECLAQVYLNHSLARMERQRQVLFPETKAVSLAQLSPGQFRTLVVDEAAALARHGHRRSDILAADRLATTWLVRMGYEPGGLKAYLARVQLRAKGRRNLLVLPERKEYLARERAVARRITVLQAPGRGRTLTDRFRRRCLARLPAPQGG